MFKKSSLTSKYAYCKKWTRLLGDIVLVNLSLSLLKKYRKTAYIPWSPFVFVIIITIIIYMYIKDYICIYNLINRVHERVDLLRAHLTRHRPALYIYTYTDYFIYVC